MATAKEHVRIVRIEFNRLVIVRHSAVVFKLHFVQEAATKEAIRISRDAVDNLVVVFPRVMEFELVDGDPAAVPALCEI